MMLDINPAAVPPDDLPLSAGQQTKQQDSSHRSMQTLEFAGGPELWPLWMLSSRCANTAQSSIQAGGLPLAPCPRLTLGSRACPALCHLRCHPSTSWAPQRSSPGRPQAYWPSAVHCCSCTHSTGAPSAVRRSSSGILQWHHAVSRRAVLVKWQTENVLPKMVKHIMCHHADSPRQRRITWKMFSGLKL